SSGGTGNVSAQEDPGGPSSDTTPLGVDVKSIVLISHQEKATMDSSPGSDSIVIDSELPAPDSLGDSLTPFLGQPISMALLSEIGKSVVLAWRESDYPLVDVYYPEQNITGGKLQIVVREAVLGTKSTEGAVVTREDYLLNNIRVENGERVNRRIVETDLDWLNENPIRQVNLIYARGSVDGTSDIVLDVQEEKPISAYVGFANTGVAQTGEEEWSFGFNWSNPGKREHLIGYHFATDLEWDNLHAHTVFYQAFLPWRHILGVIGSHVTSESISTVPSSVEGLSRQLTFEYEVPLMRPRFNRKWRHSVKVAFDYKSTNTDLLAGGTSFFGTEVEVGQFRAQYDASVPDELGYTDFTLGLVASPGELFENNDDFSFDQARLGSEASYWYGFGELERGWRLPRDFSFVFRFTGQATSDRLNVTEQILGGGYRTVRGYDESLIRGDSGFIANFELVSPEFHLLPARKETDSVSGKGGKQLVTRVRQIDGWNAIAFVDGAAFDISDALPGEISPSLSSIGVGLRCRVGEMGYARASYGWSLDSHGLLPGEDEGGRFHFGLTMDY
ncbi:MAG: ShlB/FhaC/HecB family hemolysin secretion/activation protein, partial [Verrucomicrobiota bacterium]